MFRERDIIKPVCKPFLRPEGAATYQPRATPGVRKTKQKQALKGRHMSGLEEVVAPFTGLDDLFGLLPRALPGADLLRPLRGESLRGALHWKCPRSC
jgi:hypothetical protein